MTTQDDDSFNQYFIFLFKDIFGNDIFSVLSKNTCITTEEIEEIFYNILSYIRKKSSYNLLIRSDSLILENDANKINDNFIIPLANIRKLGEYDFSYHSFVNKMYSVLRDNYCFQGVGFISCRRIGEYDCEYVYGIELVPSEFFVLLRDFILNFFDIKDIGRTRYHAKSLQAKYRRYHKLLKEQSEKKPVLDKHQRPPEIYKWRRYILNRDDNKCMRCGSETRLEAHHIYGYKENEDYRFDVNNGITLCHECHKEYHKRYGIKNINPYDLILFLTT